MKKEPTIHGMRRRNFYLPDDLMAEVGELATSKGVSTADILRRALAAYVKAWKAKNDSSKPT